MRVISGIAKGMKLYSLEGLETRPTLDRVKEALFSKIQFDIEGGIVLDLFAGSGSLGIEALSRGAEKVVFCDNSHKAIKIIQDNLEKTGFKNKAVIVKKDYLKCLEDLNMKFNVIFVDPPYKTEHAELAVKKILEFNLLEKEGYIVVETDDENKILENLELDIYDIKKYGRVRLLFLTRKR